MALIEYRAENGVAILELNNPPANAYTLESLKAAGCGDRQSAI